jgi:hypothetical protein
MPRVKLSCYSNREGCKGRPGDVIDCSAADAAYFVNNNAGKLVDEPAPPKQAPVAEPEAQPEPETAKVFVTESVVKSDIEQPKTKAVAKKKGK